MRSSSLASVSIDGETCPRSIREIAAWLCGVVGLPDAMIPAMTTVAAQHETRGR
jgi:hypothetical protein